jgi:hypothetical protein
MAYPKDNISATIQISSSEHPAENNRRIERPIRSAELIAYPKDNRAPLFFFLGAYAVLFKEDCKTAFPIRGLMKIGIENIFRLLFEKSAKNEFKATEYNG